MIIIPKKQPTQHSTLGIVKVCCKVKLAKTKVKKGVVFCTIVMLVKLIRIIEVAKISMFVPPKKDRTRSNLESEVFGIVVFWDFELLFERAK